MPSITKREHRLADGRELIYFDDADSSLPPQRLPDLRELPPRPPTPQMRWDALSGEWVSVASARQSRVMLPSAEQDPLAPQSPGNPSEVPSDYDVVVFENRSPSFGPALGAVAGGGDAAADAAQPALGERLQQPAGSGLGTTRQAIGRCEVVCFDPAHEGSFAGLGRSRSRTVIEAWADRTAALSALPGIEQVFVFENRGEAIGVTLHHPHGQIYGYPYVTPRTQALLRSIEREGAELFADILDFERSSERIVLAGEHWSAFVPFAARWPIEVHLLPHRQLPDLASTTDAERDELAGIYLRLLRGLDALYPQPVPYIAAWHQAPVHQGRDEVRLMLQLTSPRRAADKLKFLAGSESAMGAFIADIIPEETAERLRGAIATVTEE